MYYLYTKTKKTWINLYLTNLPLPSHSNLIILATPLNFNAFTFIKVGNWLFWNRLLWGSQWLRTHYSRFCKVTSRRTHHTRCCRLVALSYQTAVARSTGDVFGFSVFPSGQIRVFPMILYEEGRLSLFVVYSARAQGLCPRSVRVLSDSEIPIPSCVPLRIIYYHELRPIIWLLI